MSLDPIYVKDWMISFSTVVIADTIIIEWIIVALRILYRKLMKNIKAT